MAGWDEEALLAGLVVEDTPVRDGKQRKRFSKTPPTTSKRRRRSHRRSPCSVPIVILSLDEEASSKEESIPLQMEKNMEGEAERKVSEEPPKAEMEERVVQDDAKIEPLTATPLPCMNRLREELSCAICLDTCFEPSTTPCGHSFCLKCLKCAASKCGKRCPKCRDLIGSRFGTPNDLKHLVDEAHGQF